jgi:hypothetical protein
MTIINERKAFVDHLLSLTTTAILVLPNTPPSHSLPRIEVQFGPAETKAFADASISQVVHTCTLTLVGEKNVGTIGMDRLSNDVISHFALRTRFSDTTIVKEPEPQAPVTTDTDFRLPIVLTLLSLV